jgi:glutathione S-transferase
MIRLYFHPGNASLAPHMLLAETGVPFELALVERDSGALRSPDYPELNPNGQIPVLASHGGEWRLGVSFGLQAPLV